MSFSKFLVVVVVALAATCATCYDETAAGIVVQDSALSDSLTSAGSRGLLRRRRRKVKKTSKKSTKKRIAQGAAENINDEGVLVNQQVQANIEGDGNAVGGQFVGPISNVNVDIGDIIPGRKLLEMGGGARDLLRRRKKKSQKKRKRKAQNAAVNDNNEGVLINQQQSFNIEGDGNAAGGQFVGPIVNTNVDTGDIFLDR